MVIGPGVQKTFGLQIHTPGIQFSILTNRKQPNCMSGIA